jgi:hypothetical protein
MADLPGTTRAQTTFLRACAKDPIGLCGKTMPSAITFRRWMRKPTFRRAVKGIRDALRFQADLHLSAAAAAAARSLDATAANGEADEQQQERQRAHLRDLLSLLKLVHARERFSVPREAPEPADQDERTRRAIVEYLRGCGPQIPVSAVLQSLTYYDRYPNGRRQD